MNAVRREDADRSRTLDDFRQLEGGMTVAQVGELFGPPDRNGGSGLLILLYGLADGTHVRVGTNCRTVLYVDHRVAGQRDTRLVPRGPVAFSPEWRTDTTVSLARQMHESCEFSAMPILSDALQDAGCDSAEILDHCRGPGPHARGCWVLGTVLGLE
jgi:hypothetical protein